MNRLTRLLGSWAILPATRCLFNKNKVSIDKLHQIWKEGTVIVTERQANYGDNKPTIMFIHGCGHSDYGVKIGDFQRAHHDQTFARFSPMKITNIIYWKAAPGNTVEIVWSAAPYDINLKASLAVFK